MIIDSLLVALGFEYDDEGLDQFQQGLDEVVDGIDKTITAVTLLATAFTGMAVASAASTDSLAKQARELDIAVGELDAYNFAAEQATGSSDGMSEALRQLSIRSSEAARGTGTAVEAFGILGINATDVEGRVKPVNQLLLESADALNALENEAQRIELADKLGLANINLLLREGSDGIQELTAEARRLGVVTAEDAAAAEAFNDQWNRVLRILTSVFRQVATKILPIFEDLLLVFQEWIQANDEVIESGIISFLEVFAVALENIELAIIAILSLKFAAAILRITLAMRAAGAAAIVMQAKIFAIVIAIAAVISAIALLIQDFIVFQRGGDSAIGRLLDRFPLLRAAIDTIGDAFSFAREKMTDFFENIAAGFRTVRELFEFIGANVGSAVDSVRGVLGSTGEFINNNPAALAFGAAPVGLGAIPAASLLTGGGTTNNNRSNTTNISRVELNVNGGDLEQVRRVATDVFNGQIEQASNNAQSVTAS